jgi:hypothetical protein
MDSSGGEKRKDKCDCELHHASARVPSSPAFRFFDKEERALCGSAEEANWKRSSNFYPKASALLHGKAEAPQAASPMAGIVKWKSPKGL